MVTKLTDMNTNTYAVITYKDGSMPSVQSKNNPDWYDFMQSGYSILHEGTQRECSDYCHEMMSELINVDFFNS